MFSFGLSFVWLWLFDMLFSVGIFEGDGTSSTAVKHWYMPIARIKMRMNGFRLRNHFKLWHFQLRSLSLILFLCVFVFIFDVYLCAHSIEGVHYRWAVSFFYDDFYRRLSQCRHSLICEVELLVRVSLVLQPWIPFLRLFLLISLCSGWVSLSKSS